MSLNNSTHTLSLCATIRVYGTAKNADTESSVLARVSMPGKGSEAKETCIGEYKTNAVAVLRDKSNTQTISNVVISNIGYRALTINWM